jgi:NhaP-type Na+/H+ and K+/H+ antiporter
LPVLVAFLGLGMLLGWDGALTLGLIAWIERPNSYGVDAVNGSAVREPGLPGDSLIAVINRDGESIPPRGSTVVQAGDRLFVLVPRTVCADLEDVFSRWRRRV